MGAVNPGLTFDSFANFIDTLSDLCPHYVWRGVSKHEFSIMPRIGHRLKNLKDTQVEDYEIYEKTIFENFRTKARLHSETKGLNTLEWMALAQHYGAPTRLLDWSENPIIALYFAALSVPDHMGDEGAILAHHMSKFGNANTIDPFNVKHNTFIRAPFITQRLAAQSAVFSISKTPWIEFVPHDTGTIMKCKITPKFKLELANLLPRLGISKQFVMADLDSYASNVFEDFGRGQCKYNKIFPALE